MVREEIPPMRDIQRCFENPKDDNGNQTDIDEITFDRNSNDYRVKIYKSEIHKLEDWSIQFAELQERGYHVLGITSDRYDEYIYIWLKENDIWEGIE